MIKKIVASIILILALCGVPFTLFAQGVKCTISGKVIDQQNSPVAYASVAIYQDKTPIAGVVTDREVGAFVERLRSSEHWDNTLVVIISDHGRPSESETASSPERHHIPMLWVGGAVNEAMEITDYISQTDLAATLLSQLGIDHSDFIFSRDISSAATSRFGYWTFNNGFGVIDSCGVTIYDHTMRKVVQNDNSDTTLLHNGKAILQRTFMEINRLK